MNWNQILVWKSHQVALREKKKIRSRSEKPIDYLTDLDNPHLQYNHRAELYLADAKPSGFLLNKVV